MSSNKFNDKLNKCIKMKLCLAKCNLKLKFNESYSYLKPKQVDCVSAGYNRDLLALLPTGYGKSLLFNLIPIYQKIITATNTSCIVLIVSPLNAIIEQQKKCLGDRAILLSGW